MENLALDRDKSESNSSLDTNSTIDDETGCKLQECSSFLTDAGIYSYCAVCALVLHDLYDNEWDRKFREQCINKLLEHLKLPKQVEAVMFSLLEGQGGQSPDAYIELLLSEPKLNGKGMLIIQDLVVFAVRRGDYDARMRVLIRHVATLLKVPLDLVDMYEESVVEYLTEEQHELTEEEKKQLLRRKRNKKIKRYTLIGLATIGGGAVLGLTGGLAAPLLGAGIGTILGGASAAALGSTAGIAIIGSLFGMAGAGLTGYKMKKRVGEIEEFAFGYLTPPVEGASVDAEGIVSKTVIKNSHSSIVTQQLHITIAISGWLTDESEDNYTRPWKSLYCSREQYYLRYESTYLLELGRAMEMILSFAVSMAAQEALKYTILSGIISAIAWPSSLITLASVIDNPWGVCCRRSAEVGKQLAEVLMSREQGQRPVTLIGFSLGARVIYYCLREMSERDNCEGIVQDAVLIGTPVTGSPSDWDRLMRVVSGKIINGYCRGDWLLKFLYRTLSVSQHVAGLEEIKCNNRRMCNVDLSDLVAGHGEYAEKIGTILKVVGIRTRDDVENIDLKLKKSSSEIPGHVEMKNSLLSVRLSKSDNALHKSLDGDGNVISEADNVRNKMETADLLGNMEHETGPNEEITVSAEKNSVSGT